MFFLMICLNNIGNVFCCAYVRDAQNFFKKMWVKTFNTKFTFHFRSSN